MSGIVFFRTENRAETVSFYTDRLGFDVWLEQEGGCTILSYDTLLVGFCDGTETETDGTVTVVLGDEAAVDDCHADLADVATGRPEANDEFGIYQFFATDPDGRTVEVQAFQHETPSVGSSEGSG